mgnify:CR=1 FL=1
MMRYHPFAFAGGLGWLVGLLFLIGIVLVVVWIVNALTGRSATRPGTPSALPPLPSRPTPNEILRERFARGEITAEEFQRIRDVLGPDA